MCFALESLSADIDQGQKMSSLKLSKFLFSKTEKCHIFKETDFRFRSLSKDLIFSANDGLLPKKNPENNFPEFKSIFRKFEL